MINKYGAHVPAGLDRWHTHIPQPLPRTIAGYAVYERIGYQGKQIATCASRETAQIIADIMLEANIPVFITEAY